MRRVDIDAILAGIAPGIRKLVSTSVESFRAQVESFGVKVAELEQKIASIPVGKDGADGKDGRDGIDGKSLTIGEVTPVLREWFDAIPTPKDGADGKSVTLEEVTPVLREWFAALPVPKDGKDGKGVSLDEVMPVLREWFDAIPKPKDGIDGTDGKSVTLDDVRPFLEAELSKWALDFERRAQDTLQRAIDRIPAPKDGKDGINGKDGRDALQLEDIEMSIAEDERTLTLAFLRDDVRVERSILLNHPIYRGVWKEGAYQKGDSVTFGGSQFIAMRETSSKPETDDSWKLCVKRGRDGRDGQQGEKGERGERGLKGETPVELQTGKIR